MKPITPAEVFSKEQEEKFAKVGAEVIEKINGFLKKRKFSFNNAIEDLHLSAGQLNYIKALYEKEGWVVTIYDDNYNTKSIKFQFIQKR